MSKFINNEENKDHVVIHIGKDRHIIFPISFFKYVPKLKYPILALLVYIGAPPELLSAETLQTAKDFLDLLKDWQ